MLKIAYKIKGKIENAKQFNEEAVKNTGHNPHFSDNDFTWKYWVEYHPETNETYVLKSTP